VTPPKLLTTEQVAAMVLHAPKTLRNWRLQGTGPPSFKIGKLVVYEETDVIRWLAEQRRNGTRRR